MSRSRLGLESLKKWNVSVSSRSCDLMSCGHSWSIHTAAGEASHVYSISLRVRVCGTSPFSHHTRNTIWLGLRFRVRVWCENGPDPGLFVVRSRVRVRVMVTVGRCGQWVTVTTPTTPLAADGASGLFTHGPEIRYSHFSTLTQFLVP